MSGLKTLAIKQKLTKADILPWFTKLGYQLPPITRKADLIDAIESNLQNDLLLKSNNVISLDMGLKNMSVAKFSKSKMGIPTLYQWFKLNLEPVENYQFNPTNYAKITSHFLHDFILINQKSVEPLTVIFERQRFRTGGSSAVLESTLKTNTIEAMLCMGLTLHNRNNNNLINIIPSPPGAMVKYWQQLYLPDKKIPENESKVFRIDLVLGMLYDLLTKLDLQPRKHVKNSKHSLQEVNFQLSSNIVHNLSNSFSTKKWEDQWNNAWSFKSSSRRLWEVSKMINDLNNESLKVEDDLWAVKKGDDLADSVLHGLAHFKYLENRKKFRELVKDQKNLKLFLN
jgi:cruciform cutting endonuclease 1